MFRKIRKQFTKKPLNLIQKPLQFIHSRNSNSPSPQTINHLNRSTKISHDFSPNPPKTKILNIEQPSENLKPIERDPIPIHPFLSLLPSLSLPCHLAPQRRRERVPLEMEHLSRPPNRLIGSTTIVGTHVSSHLASNPGPCSRAAVRWSHGRCTFGPRCGTSLNGDSDGHHVGEDP